MHALVPGLSSSSTSGANSGLHYYLEYDERELWGALTRRLNLPDIVFMICGAAIGGSGGGIYFGKPIKRSPHPQNARQGLWTLRSLRLPSIIAMLIGLFTYILNDNRLGFTPVVGLFIIGMILLRWVKPEGDRAEWSKEEIPIP